MIFLEDEYTNLPAEPELAFIQLEKKYRAELDDAVRRSDERSDDGMYYLAYINQTLAAARALQLDVFQEWEVPKPRHALWEAYREFSADVEHYLVQIKVLHGRRVSVHSVALDAATKLRIHHHIQQIREIVLKLEVVPAKREALVARLTALSSEVDRDRTRIEAYAALTLEVATTVGDAARRLKPVKGILDTLAKLLGDAKDAENARASLPAPTERKRLEPPRRPEPKTTSGPSWEVPKGGDLDDEIPF